MAEQKVMAKEVLLDVKIATHPISTSFISIRKKDLRIRRGDSFSHSMEVYGRGVEPLQSDRLFAHQSYVHERAVSGLESRVGSLRFTRDLQRSLCERHRIFLGLFSVSGGGGFQTCA
jgi:hypothetical protein